MVCSLIILLILCLALLNTLSAAFVEEITDVIAINCEQKTSHLHFYFHDIVSGKSPSAVRVAGPPNSTIFDFRNTMMVDDALTEGPKLASKIVGRAQGFYAMASQNEASLLMVMNFVFMEDKYNGSSITILGRNPVFSDVREMSIVGGSGLFGNARGYALAHTISVDPKTGDAIVEYHVYVLHFQGFVLA
ncbi:dirigent protein 22-like [Juglans microcarpa x Juglans regia]|uniref:dirigent protein 22-like n=1 Tax=Juglans microcarpa x Juglans regia TaxID=2249226 RepID=UPI001B7EAA6E|nr:dirigent protein 22-like [Juglans microcarpa x Juglans regia]